MNRASVLVKASSAVPWTLVGKTVRFLAGLATSILVVRALGTSEYGVLAIVRVVAGFLALPIGVGMGQALLRFLPEITVRGGGGGGRRLLVVGTLLQCAAWVILSAAVLAARGPIDLFFKQPVSGYLLVATLLLLVGSLRGFFDSALTARYEAKLLAITGLSGSLAGLLFTWVALRQGWGVNGILVAAALGELVAASGSAIRAFRAVGRSVEGIATRRLLGYSLPFVFLSFLNMLTWKQSETVLLGHFWSAREAGIFDVAYKLPQQLLEFVPESLWALVMAAMSESYSKNPEGLGNLIDLYYRLLFVVVAPISLIGVVLGDRMVTVLYGPEWAEAGNLSRFFFGVFSLTFFGTPLSMAIYVLEKSWANFLLALLFAAINIGLDLLLIPRYGILGALIPVAIAIAISPLARWFAVRKFLGKVTIPWGFIARAYLVSLPVLALIPFRRFVTGVPSLVIATAAGAALVVIAMRFFRLFTSTERDLISRSNLPMKGMLLRVLARSAA